jgi:hypothetical protein
MSSASTPPLDPSHADAVKVLLRVAVAYCGTRITWYVLFPLVPVAAAIV